jgi:hypothetical protein
VKSGFAADYNVGERMLGLEMLQRSEGSTPHYFRQESANPRSLSDPRGSSYLLDQRFRRFEIRCIETFRKPIIHWRQKLARVPASTLGLPEPSKAHN